MKIQQQRSMEMFERVAIFGDEVAAIQPPLSARASELFAENKTTISAIRQEARDQVSGQAVSSSGTSRREMVAQELTHMVRSMAGIARSVEPEKFPGMADKFPSPRRTLYPYPGLLTLSRMFAKHAPEYQQAFIDRDMPADFIAQLQALIVQFEGASDEQDLGTQNRSGSTGHLADLVRKGMRTVRELRACLRFRLQKDPKLQAKWKGASRVESAPQPAQLPQSEAKVEGQQQPPAA